MVSFNGVNGSSSVHGPQEPSKGQAALPEPIAQRIANPEAKYTLAPSPNVVIARLNQSKEPTLDSSNIPEIINRLNEFDERLLAHHIVDQASGGNEDLHAVLSELLLH